jgi:hypothetical protein
MLAKRNNFADVFAREEACVPAVFARCMDYYVDGVFGSKMHLFVVTGQRRYLQLDSSP